MVNIKALIVASFIATIVSGVAGVLVYYSYLEPFRAMAHIGSPVEILDRITRLEYTVTDLEGNRYTVVLENDPASKSGTARLIGPDGDVLETFTYQYGAGGLEWAQLEYSNGTRIVFNGTRLVLAEEAFFTGANYTLPAANATGGGLKPFPGAGPATMHVYLTPYLGINWDYLASIRKGPGERPSDYMDVRMLNAKVKYRGEEVNAVVLQLIPLLINPPNKWASASYTMILVLDPDAGIPVLQGASIEVGIAGNAYRLDYNLTSVEFQP